MRGRQVRLVDDQKICFFNTCLQGMQSRDSCVQREISCSITLLHTGTIKVQVRGYVSSDFVSILRIFSANTLQPVQKLLFN